MILVKSKSKPNEKVILVAESDGDMESLRFLYEQHVVFGMWKLYTAADDKDKISDEYIFLNKFYPDAVGLVWVSLSVKV